MLVVDGQYGLHPSDEEVLTWLRQHHPSKPVVLAVNKCESQIKGATQVCCWGCCWAGLSETWPAGCFVATGAQGTVCAGITAVTTHLGLRAWHVRAAP